MARMVGDQGRVIAIDLQQEMLKRVRRRAEKEGLQSRILLHPGKPDTIAIQEAVDFALAFWMAHEVLNLQIFFRRFAPLSGRKPVFYLSNPGYTSPWLLFRKQWK